MISGNLLSVREIADRLGWSPRTTRRRLTALHEKHGGLLYRSQAGERKDGHPQATKLWIDPAALGRIMPDRFGADDLSPEDVLRLLDKLQEIDGKATRALAEVAELRRKLSGRPPQRGAE